MSLMCQLSLGLVRYAVSGACKLAGLPTGGDDAVEFLISRFSDPSQRLSRAATTATDRAWNTLELALAGESHWDKLTKRAEDRAFAEELRLALVVLKYDDPVGNKGEFFRSCLAELRAARKTPALSGPLGADELRRHQRSLSGYAAPTLVAAEWSAADAMADECVRVGYTNLAKFLRFRLRVEGDELPFLTVAVRYYFRQAVTGDADLSREWVFAKLEDIGTAQERQFSTLATTLDRHAARLEGMLAEVLVVAEETRQGVDRLEVGQQKSVGMIEDLLREMVEMRRLLGLTGREVRPADASRIQQPADARRVGEMSTRVRALPEDERRRHPELVLAAAHLDYAAGNQDQAIAGFQAAATLADDAEARAEAHYNAYRAALERHAGRKVKTPDDYDLALRELMEAARLAPSRYTPFDPHEYQPRRILGHGGFGVTIHCHEVNADRDVAVKILLADDLERRIEDVLQEGRILAKVRHPNVVELRAVRYADPVRKARPYFVMEYLEGFTTLAEHVQKHGPLEPRDMTRIAPQIAEGLKAAHDKGVFHRDVKPANVMIRFDGEGEEFEDRRWSVKLIDFGLAVRRDLASATYSTSNLAHSRSTIGVEVAGTLHYAAPEQMDAEFQEQLGRKPVEEQNAVRTRSDIYGFGKTCIFGFTGHPDMEYHEAQRLHDWGELLARCTTRQPDRRPHDFAVVLEMLRGDGLYVPVLPEDAVGKSLGPPDPPPPDSPSWDGAPPPDDPIPSDAFDLTPLKAAGASVLPGLGHLLFVPSQRPKGAVLLLASVLVLIPVLGFYWPSLLVAWVLLVATDAFFSVRAARTGPTPGWTVFGVEGDDWDRWSVAAAVAYCIAVVAVVLAVSGWLTSPPSKHREWIVGTWERKDGKPVEFTSGGAVIYQGDYGTTSQGRYKLVGSNALEITSDAGVMGTGRQRYTIEFPTQNELVLVAQERDITHPPGSFPDLAGKLIRANVASASAETAQPDPRFLGEWTKPDDAGSNQPYDGRHWRANYSLTITPTTVNWSYLEQVGRGPTNVNNSSRYRWTKPDEIQLLDAKSEGGAKQTVTVRLEFISDRELLLVVENEEKVKYNPFAYLKGKFKKK